MPWGRGNCMRLTTIAPVWKKKEVLASFFFFCFLIVKIPTEAAEPDWGALEKEAGDLLSRYIRVDTTNPPGNEIAAAQFWKKVLAQEGLSAQLFESQPGRGVVYARLKGS